MISFWMFFWKWFFIVMLVLFAGMSVWVAIGGFLDIKKLFARLEKEQLEIEKSNSKNE